jgi:hypothetical protein
MKGFPFLFMKLIISSALNMEETMMLTIWLTPALYATGIKAVI